MSGSGCRLIAVSEARQSAICPVASAGGLLRATAPTAPLPVVVLSSVIRGRFALLSPTPCNPEFNYFLLITSSYSWRLLLMLLGYSAVFLPNFLICIPDSGLFIYCQQIITVAGRWYWKLSIEPENKSSLLLLINSLQTGASYRLRAYPLFNPV